MSIKSTTADPEAVELFRRAYNYIDQHRSQTERNNEIIHEHNQGGHNSHGGAGGGGHKGHVTDPEHDHRLTENRKRDDKDRDEREQADENKAKEAENKKKNRFQQLKQIQKKMNPLNRQAAGIGGQFRIPTKVTHPIQPKKYVRPPSTIPDITPTPAAPPAPTAAPPSKFNRPNSETTDPLFSPQGRPGPTADQYAERENGLLTGPINGPFRPGVRGPNPGKYTPAPNRATGHSSYDPTDTNGYDTNDYGRSRHTDKVGPPQVSNQTMLQQEVSNLRGRPDAAKLMGTDRINPNDTRRMEQTINRLRRNQQRASSVQESNEIQIKLSKIAVELIKAGKLNIRNG